MPLVTVNINVGCRCVDREPQLRLRTLGPVTEQELPGPSQSGVRMIAVLRDTQKVLANFGAFEGRDAKGSVAPLQAGSLKWRTSNPDVATVDPVTEDPIVGSIKAGLSGICEIWGEVDADTTDGEKILETERVGVQVTAGMAVRVGGTPTLGTPQEQ